MRKKKYVLEDGAGDLYIDNITDTSADRLKAVVNNEVRKYRLKTTVAGSQVESEIYPIWDNRKTLSEAKSAVRTASHNHRLYEKRKLKYLKQLINANFGKGDTWSTFTYTDDYLPQSLEDANKCMINYIRRLKYKCKKQGITNIKYIYITEVYSKKGEIARIHHHFFCNVNDRDLIESIWKCGRTASSLIQPDDNGSIDGLSTYCSKARPQKESTVSANMTAKSYVCSTNLDKPEVYTADYKISRKKAYHIANDKLVALQMYAELYSGMEMIDYEVRENVLFPGIYIYARFVRR